MSDCPFEIGDWVDVNNQCGVVEQKTKKKAGWVLLVNFSGVSLSVACSSASPCTHRAGSKGPK